MKALLRILLGVGLVSLVVSEAIAQRVGDEWVKRRGDQTQGTSYDLLTQTGTGRLIAVGEGGSLMISDDGGTNWTFGQIKIAGQRIRGTVTAAKAFGGASSLVALMTDLVDAPGGDFAFSVQTSVLRSSDNGATWTKQVFPHDRVLHEGNTYYGVNLVGLHVSPAGDLLAYGTTTVTDNAVLYWSTGGVIYRSSNASTWEEASFAYGALSKISDAGGRMVATGLSTVLDSVDGAAWLGYPMTHAAVAPPVGDPLSFDALSALWLLDVVFEDDNYIAQAAQFLPRDGFIDTGQADALYTLVAPTPFDGARMWTAYEQPRLYGSTFVTGSGLAGVGTGAFTSGDGTTWTLADATVIAPPEATVKTGASTLVSVGSSEDVWKSTDSGASWTKIWDPPVGEDLRMIGTFGGTVFAYTPGSVPFFEKDLYASEDNGLTWEFRSDEPITSLFEVGDRLITRGVGAESIRISDDRGFTWQTRTAGAPGAVGGPLTQTPTGRIVLVGGTLSVSTPGTSYVSDDGGETWASHPNSRGWGGNISAIGTSAGGTIIGTGNTLGPFDPYLHISRDNGETWEYDNTLQSLEGLDGSLDGEGNLITNIELRRVRSSPTGRILLLGTGEIVMSDDEGVTWTVAENFAKSEQPAGIWNLRDLVYTGSRWIATGMYTTPYPHNEDRVIALISDDDGTTWKRIFVPVQVPGFASLTVGLDERVIAGGWNGGAVYTSDAFKSDMTKSPIVTVREGTTGQLTIERPPVPGVITATYGAIDRTAQAGVDFVATSGDLTWEADETAPLMVTLETIDNDFRGGNDRDLVIQLTFENDDVKGNNEIPVLIEDDDGTLNYGILLQGANSLYTTEQGGTADLKISLERPTTADVTLTVTGLDESEGTLSATSFIFTPANWNVQQVLTITGVDDSDPDGDSSYVLYLTPSSSFTRYNKLPPEPVSVVNIGDEPYDSGFDPPVVIPPTVIPPTVPGTSAAPDNSAARAALLKKIKKLKKKGKNAKRKQQTAKVKKYKKTIKKLTVLLRTL